MVPPDRMLAFTVAAFVLIVVPGPSVLFVLSRALAYGRRAALLTVAGGATGSFLLAATVAAGVGALIQTSTIAYTVLKLAGAAYLVYLGIRAIRHRRQLRAAFEGQVSPLSGRRTWWEGFVVSITNPKSAAFFAAVLPQFVDPSAGHPSLQMLVLGAIFATIALASDSVWGAVAGAVRSWFARSTRRLDLMGGAAGLTMIGLGLGLALTGRKD
ncbi:Threonine/homoserine/homoserine lactone efflux protein [Haloechinothrix alba]|uniref:Threonine/homoserine/homoserine lactone efflux protein n=1 Tax=Haloechinothrix alba TaxID=664784 RepID=A0A238Z704_9PSEU|nr:LysE family translocator [Haloechinothrix alba]SNR78701.1 Threonine/homoserine/homoserine lactone efflux protein [Haloechinothrix alba]